MSPGARVTTDAFLGDLVQQEVCKLRPCERDYVIGEVTQQSVIARIVPVLLITLPLAAHFKEMLSPSHRQVISIMKRVGVVAFIGKRCTNIRQALSNAYCTEARDRLTTGDANLCVGVPNPRPVVVVTDKGGPVEANSSFVHGARADGPIPSQYEILRALSSRS